MQEGALAEITVPALLFAHAVHDSTLVLEIHRRQVWKKVIFEQGVPVDCRSNLAHETLGRFLVLEGKLSHDDFTSCLSRSAALGVPLGEVLIERGLITPPELFRVLQQNLAKKLLDLFSWQEGEFRVLDEEMRLESPLKVRVPQLILTGVAKLAPQDEVDMSVGPLVGKKLILHPAPPFPIEEIRFSQSQSRMVEALRRGCRMGELAEATGLPFEEITRLLYALSILGLAVPADSLPKDLVPTTAVPVQKPAPRPAPPTSETVPVRTGAPQPDVDLRRNQIMQAYLSYRRQDALDLLGVAEDSRPPVWEEKFLEYAQRFAPWTLDHPDLAPLAERARDLFLAGARAFAEIADVESRNTLLYRRKVLREERSKKTASFAIKTDLLDPEIQFAKGKELMEAGRYKEAVQYLEFAFDCDPQNSVYGAELAYCRFLHTDGLADRATRDLAEILRRDPGAGLAAYYAGEIHRCLRNWDEAEELLRRALKTMSPDRRPIEALKVLATERRR